ncbi:hypothetical protein CPB84DRAFT_1854068 [Gymnopilus junonius]|uniref:DUF6818 domain-containing protein n=1 Tax=Gymnopilus junonius TaxID=109634 RepID=A0A9P5TF84_GYMJU|nr:hypothetical protein CPB84DRAFT_1854068 [Gymnopilus junonius]
MSEPSKSLFPQYFTNVNGAKYCCSSADAQWLPVQAHFQSGPPQVAGMPGNFNGPVPGTGIGYFADSHNELAFPSNAPYHANGGSMNVDYNLGPTGRRLPVPPAIDPSTIPLPDDDDDDDELPPVHKIFQTMARPVSKVAGSRRPQLSEKAKGKQRAVDPSVTSGSTLKRKASTPLSAPADTIKRPKGHSAGAANYSGEDLDALFDILEESLPLGGHAWNSATDEFNAWAEENECPTQTAKSLELKFKQLIKTSKPTGDAECPPHVLRAHEIDELMNEKAGSRDLDNEDIIDANNVIEVSDTEEKTKEKKAMKTATKKVHVKKEKEDDRIQPRVPCNSGQELLSNISSALDPRTRFARNEENALTALQSQQIFQLNGQLHETQRQLEGLRLQLSDAEQLVGMLSPTPGDRHHGRAPPPASPIRTQPRQRQPHYRQDIYYKDGHMVRWVGGSSDDEEDYTNDSPGTRHVTSSTPVNWPTPPGYIPCHRSFSSPQICAPSPFHAAEPASPHIRPPSPFRSAASSLNNMLDPSSSCSHSTVLSLNDNAGFNIHVAPHAGPSSSISVLISPARRRDLEDTDSASVNKALEHSKPDDYDI